MASSSTSASIGTGFFPRCYCRKPAIVWTSSTPKNPGKKFFGCDAGREGCNFFKWCDDRREGTQGSIPGGSELIDKLIARNDAMGDENRQLREEIATLKMNAVELKIRAAEMVRNGKVVRWVWYAMGFLSALLIAYCVV